MNAVELMLPDGRVAGVWMCGQCRLIYTPAHSPFGDGKSRTYTPEERDAFARQKAERCCNYRCEVCGDKCKPHHHLCGTHQAEAWRKDAAAKELALFEKATKIPAGQWDGVGMLYSEQAEEWFRDLDAFADWLESDDHDRPAYLWLSKRNVWSPDVRGRIESDMFDRYHEDDDGLISAADWKRLDDFVTQWWSEVEPASWEPDYTRCLLLSPLTPKESE